MHELTVTPFLRQWSAVLTAAIVSAPDANFVTLQTRLGEAMGQYPSWLAGFTRAVIARFPAESRCAEAAQIRAWLLKQADLLRWLASEPRPQIHRWFVLAPQRGPAVAAFAAAEVPALATLGDLARCLQLAPMELAWLADAGNWRSARPGGLHYYYQWQAKTRGGWRLIESPKERLRAVQRRILRDILNKLPTHPAAHGCVSGRSALSHARMHQGAPVLLRLDVSDFFASITLPWVRAVFASLGYPYEVAQCLALLTTHATPQAVLRMVPPAPGLRAASIQAATQRDMSPYSVRHLPQGAPTSPALANLCAWRLDLRLSALAHASSATYSRYVDDLVLSCRRVQQAQALAQTVSRIVVEAGLSPNPRKTRITTQAQAQRTTGLVVNVCANVPRVYFDRLKAILTNCLRHGPASQNRDQHADFRAYLLGCIAHVTHINPVRGAKLRALFVQIVWG